MTYVMPPRWAETLLRIFLSPRDRDSVSGDLLEEYRETIHPDRGRVHADFWYVRSVMGYLIRSNLFWAVLFSVVFVARTAVDWLMPTTDFHFRSQVSTAFAVGILLCSGFWSAWRSGFLWTGAIAGLATTALAGIMSVIGVGVLLLIFHDPKTFAAIRGSGGLEEAFSLPLMLVIPGTVIATLGGLFGGTIRKLVP